MGMAVVSVPRVCPLPANAALLEVQPTYAIWVDPRGLAMIYGALLVFLGTFAWLFEWWWWLLPIPIGVALHAVVWLATGGFRRRARWRLRQRDDWGSPAEYSFSDLGGKQVVVVSGSLLCVVAWIGIQSLGETEWLLSLAAIAAAGPGAGLLWLAARPARMKLRLGVLPWALGQRRQVRLRLLDGALAFEGVTAWVRVLESTKPGHAELLHEECIVHEPERKMASADEIEFVVPVRPRLPRCRLADGHTVWWELVVLGRRHGGDIHWIYLLPVEEPLARGEKS